LSSATAGQSAPITIQVKDEFGNLLKSGGAPVNGTITDLSGKLPPLKVEVFDNQDGTYGVSYNLDKAGDYQLDLKLGDASIKNAPFKLHVDPADTSVDNAEVTWLGNPIAGTTGGSVKLRDQFMNFQFKGGDKVIAEFLPQTALSVAASDKHDGTYDIVYPPGSKGKHEVKVSVNGKVAPGGPYQVDIQERPVDEETKKKIAHVLPHSSYVLQRLMARASDSEKAALLQELSSFKS